MQGRVIAAAALGLALTPWLVLAAEPSSESGIVGGTASEPCEWPSVVALRTGGVCTATLVHPRIIVYAAHCGTYHSEALFGEDIDNPARTVPILHCERNSDLFAVSSMDYAYCELAEPVEDVALTPVLFGCDESLIAIGTPVTIVGFGDTQSEGPEQVGIKHAAQTQIVGYLSTIGIGGMGTGADSGDSGGPALVQLDDGSWRTLGIVSGGGGDGASVQYVPAPKTVAWIEERSGVDITPCHASDGSWAPTPACAGMFVGVDTGASWAEGCPGPVSPPSDRCGPAFADVDDDQGPSVAFVEPLDGSELPLDGSELGQGPVVLDVVGEAEDLGVGVRELRLFVDDLPWMSVHGQVAVDEVPPYRFEAVVLELDGPHELTLEAIDHYGNRASVSATVFVGDVPSETGEAETGEDETGPAADDQADPEPGCACSTTPQPERLPGLLALSVLVCGLRSRRRSRARIRRRR